MDIIVTTPRYAHESAKQEAEYAEYAKEKDGWTDSNLRN